MDTYDDPPNPFSTDPSPAPSRDEQATQGGGSSSGMLPPTQPAGSGSQAGVVAYPELDIYPSNANTNANTTRGFGGERGKLFGEDDNDDEDEDQGVKGITAGYPQLNLYPAVDTPNQESGPWSNSQAPGFSNTNSNSQPQFTSRSQSQSQSQSPNKPASSPPPPTYRPSFPNAGAGIKSYVGPRVKEEACCAMDEELQVRGGGIEIIDAVKTNDGGRASYITYVIRTGNRETHHRYSHFDSLRTSLQALYPVLIVPPIPSKQSLTDYAVKGSSKAKEDATVIARRMRTLEDFLRRVGRHPILGGEHVFHRFLDGVSGWNDVLHSPPLSLLPKNPLHAPTYNPTIRPSQPFSPASPSQSATTDDLGEDRDPTSAVTQTTAPGPPSPGPGPGSPDTSASPSYIAHHLLPNVSAATPLKHPDGRFMDSEAFTDKFAHHLSSVMERVNRRVVKRWGERAHGASEMGAIVNGLSLDLDDGATKELTEGVGAGTRGVQEAVEKFGQAIDAEHMSTALLLQHWERSATEPLHIYAQYGVIIRQRLSFRHQKHVQYELVQSTLEHQREKLEVLEKAEKESRRLEEALESGGRNLTASGVGSAPAQGQSVLTGQSVIGGSLYREPGQGLSDDPPAGLPRTPTKRKGGGGGYGLLSAVKHSLSGMMDVDPEATRRANIGRTRDNISQLEDSLQAAAQDLKYASQTLQADLDRFQRQKVADMRDMTLAIAELHREWAKANLKAWEEAKLAIQAIEPHPNRPLQLDDDEPLSPQSAGVRQSPQQQRSFTVDRSRTEVSSGPAGFTMDSGFATVDKDDEDDVPPPIVKDHPL
ncbi:hypothetical protein FFLO_04434 [Filobasidium floriforme]|uniref:PX domain-containing protein n=1 Tax=Filobasidium floriforme TaxID=5210 RepID=A0A8K0JIV5_9TREE|nr:uncharacterized protein HD553DRAFT_306719 [Filobasidium floriforme]KAG7531313.1 hypothetical protein FFLO_04434 [Filobasidium floriforme]KAH8088563.1 hypothetical protein HD553DRAFT_306719 [Filobasidium floriforme]